MALIPGTRLGAYEIAAQIGEGGMGLVYRARDTRLERDVALKILPEAFAHDADRLARFRREARTLASLNHPNIAAIYGLEESGGVTALVMELVEGDDLSQRIARGAVPVDDALAIAKQVAAALDAAHGQGTIHRDLKPANIKVRSDGTVKVLDFGLAKVLDTNASSATTNAHLRQGYGGQAMMTGVGMLLGTAAYMSPEQAQGQPLDERSDIFSFGTVLYELVSGRRPFTGDSMVEVLSAVIRDEPAPLDAPGRVRAVVQRCMAKQAVGRYASFTDVRAALDAIGAAETPATSRPPSIAVLPFANLSADKENEYFGDGLAEEILNALTRLPGLRVVARASAFAFRGREHDVGAIVEKLSVTSVLHGSVRRSGNRIRVSAHLIDVRDESQLWSERYDREMRDVFDIQDEIAQAIVESLKVQLGARTGQRLVKRYTENLVAHSLYLKGNFHLYRLTREAVDKGRAYLEEALALEPGHAPAWVQLADFYIAGCFMGRAPAKDLWPRAKEAAERAVESDPEFADAHAAVGFVAGVSEYLWADAMRHLDTALRLNAGSGRTHLWRSQVLMPMGRSEQSLESAAQAVALDPLFLLYRAVHGNRLLNRQAYEAAAEGALQDLDINPHFSLATMNLARAYSGMGRHDEAIVALESVVNASHGGGRQLDVGLLSWCYLAVGRRADAERFVGRLEEERRATHVPGSTLALATLGLGDHAGAQRWLEESIDERDPNLINVVAHPNFEPLHAEPGYRALLRRMNLG